QTRAMRKVAGQLRLSLAQYRELATFAQFGTADLDPATRAQLAQGQLATEVLKQAQYMPLSLADEVIVLFAVNEGLMEGVEIPKVAAFQDQLLRYISGTHPDIVTTITDTKDISDEVSANLTKAINDFKSTFTG
ncbi:MAG: F0F1 ATP synthase subunit alpha, partial [Chloroflexi bacterium]|nr:F0F1 ATP synthase subunit alpha [Chloroflexota bacterium]